MTTEQRQFTASMRLLHWLIAAMVLTMLSIGVAMVASIADYHRIVVGDRMFSRMAPWRVRAS